MKKGGSVCVFALIFIGSVIADVNPEEYLSKYGYLPLKRGHHVPEKPTPKALTEAILKFQSFTGLPKTGKIDTATLNKMRAPRCDVQDIYPNDYQPEPIENRTLITWKITQYSGRSPLSTGQTRNAIGRGFKLWASVTPLIIQETRSEPAVDVRFVKDEHGDNRPMYEISSTLGHANPPPNGFVHFNGYESWEVDGENNRKNSYDLEFAAAHEFGHVLGLNHTSVTNAIMYPIYKQMPVNFKLHPNDVASVQHLYGKKPIGDAHFCNYSYKSLDAAMRISKTDYVFVDEGQVIDGRTGKKMAVQRLFPGGPDWVQAAVYSKEFSKAYLFKVDKIWAYTVSSYGQFSLVEDYPKPNLAKYSHNPECAVRYTSDKENIYLIKDGFIFIFSPIFGFVVSRKPFYASNLFRGIPSKLDAAISEDYKIRFIVEKQAFTLITFMKLVNPRGVPSHSVFNRCPSLNNF